MKYFTMLPSLLIVLVFVACNSETTTQKNGTDNVSLNLNEPSKANTSQNSKFVNIESRIVGKWRDENSVIEYHPNGGFEGRWDQGSRSGRWSIDGGDVLIMEFPLVTPAPKYKILEFSDEKFVIQSIPDGEIFSKEKI